MVVETIAAHIFGTSQIISTTHSSSNPLSLTNITFLCTKSPVTITINLYSTGLAFLLAATILLFVGDTIAVLVVARMSQGLSCAIVWTVGLAMTRDTVGSENLGVTIGSMFGLINFGGVAGPVVGGVLYKMAGSGAVFGVAFALLMIDFAMRLAVIEKRVAAGYRSNDASSHDEAEDQDSHGTVGADEVSPLLNRHSNATF